MFAINFVMNQDSENWVIWVCLGISVMFGCIVGYFIQYIRKIGAMACGSVLGYFLGSLMYDMFIHKIETDPQEVNY